MYYHNGIIVILFMSCLMAASVDAIRMSGTDRKNEDNQAILTKQHIDRLLEIISPACRQEMEGALDSQLEVSEKCKVEIQTALTSGFPGDVNAQDGTIDPLSAKMKKPAKYKEPPLLQNVHVQPPKGKRSKKNSKNQESIWYTIFKYVVGSCLAIGGIAYYRKMQNNKDSAENKIAYNPVPDDEWDDDITSRNKKTSPSKGGGGKKNKKRK